MTVQRRITGAERLRRQDSLVADLAAVAAGRLSKLRQIWSDRLGEDPPPALRSPEILRRMLAYRLQAAVHGDISPAIRRKLAEFEARRTGPKTATPTPTRLRSGAKLIRDWKGVAHEVWVVEAGFIHQGLTYKSLSEIARVITGTRWNGPLFFGLREKMKEAA
jgi:hypothetical protein